MPFTAWNKVELSLESSLKAGKEIFSSFNYGPVHLVCLYTKKTYLLRGFWYQPKDDSMHSEIL